MWPPDSTYPQSWFVQNEVVMSGRVWLDRKVREVREPMHSSGKE